MQHINLPWSQFKVFVDSRSCSIQWFDVGNAYNLYVFDSLLTVNCIILKTETANIAEFEPYKALGNYPCRVKVDAHVTTSAVQETSAKLKYADMATIARGATIVAGSWVSVFSYSGSGSIYGWALGIETAQSNWLIRFVVDGEEVFSSAGLLTDDMSSSSIYNLAVGSAPTSFGINVSTDTSNIKWSGPLTMPVKYNSNVQILVKRITANKSFRGGLVTLTKET